MRRRKRIFKARRSYHHRRRNVDYSRHFQIIIAFLVGAIFFAVIFNYVLPVISESREFSLTESNIVELKTLAVNSVTNEGMTIPLVVEARPGSGAVLADIDNLLFWVDTQQSIQLSKNLAQQITNTDLSNVDLVYYVNAINSSSVSGGSAGAALTVATVAAITGQTLPSNVAITGAVNQDGTIGRIGGVVEKARAAAANGIDILVVPSGQSELYELRPVKECDEKGKWEVCTIEYEKEFIEVGVEIVEVSNIMEVFPYFGVKI